LQSFMEITMANTQVAMIDQNINNTTKQVDRNCGKESIEINHQISFSTDEEEPNSSRDNYSTHIQSDFECINNKTHELMQQSMSDYVTNQSLNLAIPESCDLSNINCADEDTRKKCEAQTENILLMKWPAQYYNNIQMLKEKNRYLTECTKEKESYIHQLKLDNEDLLVKLSAMNDRSKDLDLENYSLKHTINTLSEDKDLIITLQRENLKLSKDLENLKTIEIEFSTFKTKNEEFIREIENDRFAKESEINVLNTRIQEMEREILNMSQAIVDYNSKKQEIDLLTEIVHSKDDQIETLLKDKTLLEDDVSHLRTLVETLDAFRTENVLLKDEIKLEKENCKEIEEIKILLEKQKNDINVQNEQLSSVLMQLNEKELLIEDLFKDKISLEETVAALNNKMEGLKEIGNENMQLKLDLQEEKSKSEEVLLLNTSLMEQTSSQVGNISKLSKEICEKDNHIVSLSKRNAELTDIIGTLNQRLEELNTLQEENEQLNITMKQRDEEITQIKKIKNFIRGTS